MLIIRDTPSLKSTIGILTVPDTTFTCFTLEDVCRALGFKLPKESAIPEGCMKCKLTFSNRFQRVLPLIYNRDNLTVEDGRGVVFSGIRIHNGVNHLHTEGCILVGYEKGVDQVFKPAADDLTKLLLDKYGINTEFDIQIMNKQF